MEFAETKLRNQLADWTFSKGSPMAISACLNADAAGIGEPAADEPYHASPLSPSKYMLYL